MLARTQRQITITLLLITYDITNLCHSAIRQEDSGLPNLDFKYNLPRFRAAPNLFGTIIHLRKAGAFGVGGARIVTGSEHFLFP